MRRGLAMVIVLGSCSRAPAEPTSTSTQTPASVASSASSSRSTAELRLRWDDPPRWQRRTPSNATRAGEYLVPRARGDATDAECVVITFGPGQGGGVDQNIDRWVGQFSPLTGSPAKNTRMVNGMAVTRVEATGTYRPMRMPGAPPGPESIPGSRLVAAIVEAPSGSWFFKMTGPDETVRAAAAELDKMVDSARPN